MEVTGYVDHIIYRKPENGYTVFVLISEGDEITCVGTLGQIDQGDYLQIEGDETEHPVYGVQIKVKSYRIVPPSDADSMERYLGSGAIKGVGPATAERIVEKFGSEALDILDTAPERLASIKGISEEQAKNIGEEFKKQYAMRTVMLGLEKYGFSPAECIKIFRKLGINAVSKVEENPYTLCGLSIGITFERAEMIEEKLPQKPLPDYRISEGIVHVVRHNSVSRGHTCIPREKLLKGIYGFCPLMHKNGYKK